MKHLISSLLAATFAFFSFTSNAQYAHSLWMENGIMGTEANCFINDLNNDGFLLAGYVSYDSGAIYHVNDMGVQDWHKTFYNNGSDITFYTVIHTQDAHYLALGGKDFDGNTNADCSAWLVKLDDAGTVIWEETFGGPKSDILYDIKQTADGGYIAVGKTNSATVPGYHDYYDLWIVKFNSTGDIEWEKALGGTNDDEGVAVIETAGGDYVALGTTGSDDGDVSALQGTAGYMDIWMIKLDNTGNIVWEKTLGGTLDEWAGGLISSDTTFMVLGATGSSDGHVSFNHGNQDVWIIRTDTMGNILWEKSYGSNSMDGGGRGKIKETTQGHFTVASRAANTMPGTNGDLHCHGYGGWLFNIDSTGSINWGWQYGGTPAGVEFNSGSYVTGGTYYPWPGIQSQYWVARVQEINVLSCDPTLDVGNATTKGQQAITVYPTITNGKINIGIPVAYSHPTITVADLMGRPVLVQERASGTNREIMIDDVAAGVYFLTVASDGDAQTFKIIYQP